jgi:two-component system chemotaxis response regulator CheB
MKSLHKIMTRLPVDSPAIMVVQHIPAGFTRSLTSRLDSISKVVVCEAQHDQLVVPGHVYIAPGNYHMRLERIGGEYVCKLATDLPVSDCRPSIDVLFNSIARVAGEKAIGVILSGKGRDGVEGLLAMRRVGAATIGEDEQSSIVYDMPGAAMEKGACTLQRSAIGIAPAIIQHCYSEGASVQF